MHIGDEIAASASMGVWSCLNALGRVRLTRSLHTTLDNMREGSNKCKISQNSANPVLPEGAPTQCKSRAQTPQCKHRSTQNLIRAAEITGRRLHYCLLLVAFTMSSRSAHSSRQSVEINQQFWQLLALRGRKS